MRTIEDLQLKQSLPLNTRQNKICDDAISREAVRKCFYGIVKMDKDTLPYVEDYLRTVMHRINELPPVTQKSDNKYRKEAKRWKNKWLKSQKSGKWIKKEDDTCWCYACSECEQEPLKNRWNDDDVLSAYCPNCGAKMESEDKE